MALPYDIGQAAAQGEFDRVKAWLAGGSASDPHSVNAVDDDDWTLLHWTAASARSPEHVEFARYLISHGVRIDKKSREEMTALHFACGTITGGSRAAMVSMLITAGAAVNTIGGYAGRTPLFSIYRCDESTLDIVTILLRAGASLDSSNRSFEDHLNDITNGEQHVGAIRTLVASVRAAGSWKAHCISPHKQVLRLRSLVARGRVKLPSRTRRRSPRGREARQARALEFVVRQGDNGIVWNILSFWRETA